MIDELINTPCTVILREGDEEAEFGVPDRQTSSLETVCYLEQGSRSEDPGAGEASVSDWLVIFKADEEGLDTASALVVGNQRFEFVGAPWQATDPEEGSDSHIEATVRFTGVVEGS